MRISYNWLKEHVELALPAADLSQHLLQLGFEVSEHVRTGAHFTGVVTAKVVSKDKHPNADKLSVCVVDDGTQKWNVVCGAPNVAAGQTVAFARIGAVLPGGFKITKAKLRGVESQGMICSTKELGLGGDHSGILVLDPATPIGEDFAKGQPCDDILEVEITPNRPDCLSHRGLARELAAYFRLPLKRLPAHAPSGQTECLDIDITAPQGCGRYRGRLLEGVTVGPSPDWLKTKLASIGQRSINNVVDATNYILHDMGQPLHAFDADTLKGGRLIVRWAKPGESLKALDGVEYKLDEKLLVIADAERPAAIAGVMGGAETGVTEKTKRILLESAYFTPGAIRRATQALRLRSDSSYRFERGVDPEAVDEASERAAEIILGSGGGKISKARDEYPGKQERPAIVVTAARLNAILGSEFPPAAVESALKAFAPVEKTGEDLKLTPPSWRGDLATAWDLAEEVGRMLGYNNIPSRLPAATLKPARALPAQQVSLRCAQRLADLGLSEALNYDFVSEKMLARAGIALAGVARLANPVSEDFALMRPTLLVGLLQSAATNANRGAAGVRLFEIGKTYRQKGDKLEETWRVAGLLYGPAAEPHWRGGARALDYFDAKGIVADLLRGLPGLEWRPCDAQNPMLHPAASQTIALPQGVLGSVGRLHPAVARAWELEREEVLAFELDLEPLFELPATRPAFVPFSPFPGIRRDLSLLLGREVSFAALDETVRSSKAADLKGVELIDVFSGAGVPEGKQSLTVRLFFGRDDRTLRDAEVASAVDLVIAELARRHGAALRS